MATYIPVSYWQHLRSFASHIFGQCFSHDWSSHTHRFPVHLLCSAVDSLTMHLERWLATTIGKTPILQLCWASSLLRPLCYRGCWSVIVAAELVALPLVMQFWTTTVPDWACKRAKIQKCVAITVLLTNVTGSLIWLVVVFILNAFGAKSYGEAEYWFSMVSVRDTRLDHNA